MKLRIYPDPILSKSCAEVRIGDSKIPAILDEMAQKLYKWEGAGLAAPQVGIMGRVVVIDIRDEPKKLYKLVNPKITWKSDEIVESNEGCLSLPILRKTIKRYESVVMEYFDENFEKKEIYATGFLSCCLQHELDHLDGILYIDHLSRLKKARALSEFKKIQEAKG
ncbi:MAG: peptide deformylase [Holosporaceae bacterium]|nr:peptide deformylase [Holosporaceae bacterium]